MSINFQNFEFYLKAIISKIINFILFSGLKYPKKNIKIFQQYIYPLKINLPKEKQNPT